MTLGWIAILRLGLVQMCIGSIVVLTTSTLNRLMVVELALPAVLPGLLVGLHYAIQITRPNWGFLSDTTGNRSFWIVAGLGVLGLGAFLAACAVLVMAQAFWPGMALSMLAYAMIGVGAGASGTSLLALLASAVAPERRAAAATITWLTMIGGIALTATLAGLALDPYSPTRLLQVVGLVASGAVALACLALRSIERPGMTPSPVERTSFREGLAEVWQEPKARRFTVFVFLSMGAYFVQELILEPYAGLVFAYTPGQSTTLAGAQNAGVFCGMALVGMLFSGFRVGGLRLWVVLGCTGSALMLILIAALGSLGPGAPLPAAVFGLGLCNGVFAVAAIGCMMALAGQGRAGREGTRMGLWGAAQAISAGFGGLIGAALVDVMRAAFASDAAAFGLVFCLEAALFLAAAAMAMRILDAPLPVPKRLTPRA
ncbi:BCD family MFS transporter [Sulfitobacter sp. D35]|uniref:BCD family MFS transporter n=1 Tax=Sulfitobacter sp. D35 TaxID=3083252 RepID=UPI00296EC7B9|nr:BCD family MFS transporter [Sulfitobacter sp. D35]MDW4499249.1 BCD family MFS transporter [Sulfitobacter sp. D35]